jgi:hypothetical protein
MQKTQQSAALIAQPQTHRGTTIATLKESSVTAVKLPETIYEARQIH